MCKKVCRHWNEVGNNGSSLQVLHVHVLLVSPLGTSHMTQPGTNQHKGRVAVHKTARHTSTTADLAVQSLNDIVGADASPVFIGKLAVGQCLLNAIFYLLAASFTLLSRRRYRSMIAVLKEIALSLGPLRVTSTEVVVRLRFSGRYGTPGAVHCTRIGLPESASLLRPPEAH